MSASRSVASSGEMLRQSVKHTRPAQKNPQTHANKSPIQLEDERLRQQPVDLTIKMQNPFLSLRRDQDQHQPRLAEMDHPNTSKRCHHM